MPQESACNTPVISPRRVLRSPSAYALAAVAIILVAAIGLRLHKAASTGIVYDEAASLFDFGVSFRAAWTSYINPNNNHVVNSFLMNISRSLFRGCEYFFRLHTMAFSVIYCLSIAALVWMVITSSLLRVLLTGLLLFQWFVFDLSYLARGYSIALAAFCCALAILVFLLRNPGRRWRIWLAIFTLVLMNALALGAMLSAVAVILALNLCYIGFFSHRLTIAPARRIPTIVLHTLIVGALSAISLYTIYCHIWRDILAAKDNFGQVSLARHLEEVLWTSMFASPTVAGRLAYVAFLALAAAGVVRLIIVTARNRSTPWPANVPSSFSTFESPGIASEFGPRVSGFSSWPVSASQSLALCTSAATLVMLFVWRDVVGLSLGFARNGVFLMPLFLLACGILIDVMLQNMTPGLARKFILAVAYISIAIVTYAARPSLYAVQVSNWARQSVSGPLVRELKRIDPEREWSIALTDKMASLHASFLYYQMRGYTISGRNEDFMVLVYHKSEPVIVGRWYKPNLFDDFDCRIVPSPHVLTYYHIPESDMAPFPQGH